MNVVVGVLEPFILFLLLTFLCVSQLCSIMSLKSLVFLQKGLCQQHKDPFEALFLLNCIHL